MTEEEKKSEAFKKYYYSHIEERREYNKRYKQLNRERVRSIQSKWDKKNRHKRNAEKMARTHVDLREDCETCGSPAVVRHHPDYSKPLEVVSLCRLCHNRIHNRSQHG